MTTRTCDGVSRRDFLRYGAVGAFGTAGLTLPDFLRLSAAGEVDPKARGKAAIFVSLGGGPTHLDTFDLKPDAPTEVRGEFKPIPTNASGVAISELLPNLAKCAQHYAVLRGVSHTLAAHEFGTSYMCTGNRPLPSLEYPGYGSVVTKELGGPKDLPPYVAVPGTPERPGFLGISQAAFSTTNTPRPGQPYNVRGLSLAGVTLTDVQRRQKLLSELDTTFAGLEKDSDLVGGLDRFSGQAYDIMTGSRAKAAFDVAQEPAAVAKRFGATDFGMSCLLATRLVASGVRFVTVSHGGWDTHRDNFEQMKKKLPVLDQGLAGLFTTLAEKGLLESTAVLVTGEFGRTPKINPQAGRDHWPRAMTCLLAGAGIKGGQAVGASDKTGAGPAGTPITPEQVAATFYTAVGVDIRKEYHTNTGRPIMVVRDGDPIPQLIG